MNKALIEDLTKLAEDIGFARATLKGYLNPPGVTADIIEEALKRLEDAPAYIAEIIRETKEYYTKDTGQ